VSPATLVFEDVWDLEGDLGFKGQSPDLEVDNPHQQTRAGHRQRLWGLFSKPWWV
jgi:hypothetical protein